MHSFTPDTIVQATKNIEALDPKVGGLLCVLSCLVDNFEENVSYTINGEQLRGQLSLVFDKEPKDSFDGAKPSYIIFAKAWADTFFDNYIKNKVDLLSCAVFFLRRERFDREYSKQEVIDLFIKRFHLSNYKDRWFFDSSKVSLAYNQASVEDNQADFYIKMGYTGEFKSILFRGVIQKSASELKAAGQIQTLYSGSGIHTCLLLSDEPLSQYYILANASTKSAETPVDNEAAFRAFLASLVKADGSSYSETSRNAYLYAAKAAAKEFPEPLSPFTSMYQIDDLETFDKYEKALRAAEGFSAFNDARGNGALSACLKWYRVFLETGKGDTRKITFNTGYQSDFSRNRILFGAPGTGKSFTLNKEKGTLLANGGDYERVTFHPDYSYANFVGTYKPVPCVDNSGNDTITYSYVPGPFMRIYVKALLNSRTDSPQPFLLVIEEINRANVAAVFGDVFQLLDRDDDEVSQYAIQASEDIKKYLAGELGGSPNDYAKIRIPDNMFIWATMNSADQGVFPMDTAFKRRWDFTYLGIDDSEDGIKGKTVVLGEGDHRKIVEWNELRKAINDELLTYKVNEDKLMGPYFISKKMLPDGNVIDPATFKRIFKNKVIMYLFDDAAKQKRSSLFSGCEEAAKNQYSKICAAFNTLGVDIFCDAIRSRFIDKAPEDDAE